MASYRNARINDQMAQTMAEMVRDIKDPRVSCFLLSITRAEVTQDLKYAKIYYSALPRRAVRIPPDADPQTVSRAQEQAVAAQKELHEGLRHAAPYLRRRVAQTLNLRITPELQFIADHSMAHGAHIATLLHQVEDDIKRFDARAAAQAQENEQRSEDAQTSRVESDQNEVYGGGENTTDEFI